MKRIAHLAVNSWVKMLYGGKKRRYNLYKIYRNNLTQLLDQYKLKRNYYSYTYGPDDLDVVNISLLKIDDLLDDFMLRAYR